MAKRDALSKEKIVDKMKEIRAEIDAKVAARNNTESATELAKLDEEIKKSVKEYNGYGHDLVLLEHIESPDCIKELCSIRKYDTLSTKTTKSDSGFRVLSIEDSKSNIDLSAINDTKVKAGWFYKCQMLALWVTHETAESLDIKGFSNDKFFRDLTTFFKISDEAKAAARETGNPSNRAVLEVLRGCVSAMIGEEQGAKVIMPHKRFIDCAVTSVRKTDNTGTVRIAKVPEVIGFVADVCHMILMNQKVQLDISKSLTKDGKKWQEDGFAPTPDPVVEVKITDDAAPASDVVSEKKPTQAEKKSRSAKSEKKSAAPAEKKSSGRRNAKSTK